MLDSLYYDIQVAFQRSKPVVNLKWQLLKCKNKTYHKQEKNGLQQKKKQEKKVGAGLRRTKQSRAPRASHPARGSISPRPPKVPLFPRNSTCQRVTLSWFHAPRGTFLAVEGTDPIPAVRTILQQHT